MENEWDINDNGVYDESAYTLPAGGYVKMHMPVVNDQLLVSVTDAIFAAVAVGDTVNPAAGGSVAKAS